MKKAFITGISGQDGSYLCELLLQKGYEVHGLIRRSSTEKRLRIDHLVSHPSLKLYYGDMTDASGLFRLIYEIRPDELYNLAAQSHVQVSFDSPDYTAQTDAIGVLRLLESIRSAKLTETCRFYQASTSELFGNVYETPQNEQTPFRPTSPYAIAKQYAYWIVKNYREAYGIFAVNGILFNHESERRGETFVTRKITLAVAQAARGEQTALKLGNLDALRDWGYAKDYVECMWLMLQQPAPNDYVIATGEQHSVREFCTVAFQHIGLHLTWVGSGLEEKGIDQNGCVRIVVDPKLFRPTEVQTLLGDPSKAKTNLGWNPKKTCFSELVSRMVAHDLSLAGISTREASL